MELAQNMYDSETRNSVLVAESPSLWSCSLHRLLVPLRLLLLLLPF